MRNLIILPISIIFVLALQQTAVAQTEKVLQSQDMHGHIEETPYLTNIELEEASLNGRGSKNRDTRSKSVDFTLANLLSPSSLQQAIDILGEPERLDQDTFANGEWAATLQYEEGTMFDFRKYEDGRIALLEFQLWQPPWSLKIGGTSLRPGMPIDSLSSAVQQSIDEGTYPAGADVDGIGTIHIAKQAPEKNDAPVLAQEGKAEITVHVNKDKGVVRIVRFVRLGPW